MMMQLTTQFGFPAMDYAGQANAIIGIRDAGKTYTAMKAAEQLLEAGIPIIVYDPVGVWKNLKNGAGDHPGYQVVVAGGEGSDILLTPDNAVDIVRAAMQEGISLVIDLYSRELINKSTWIKIVQETVDLLMYENKAHNLRHIFLEEAAEFIPQRLQPQHARVYAALERLARMGRNARLGMTIINQRAEEVNKAILEICAFSLLHKQVGKNSLASIQKWLEISQVENAKDIIRSLPGLRQGECWAIGHDAIPHQIQIAPRNTFHPNPKSQEVYTNVRVANVSEFVGRLNLQLQQPEATVSKQTTTKGHDLLKQEFAKQRKELDDLRRQNEALTERHRSLIRSLDKLREEISKLIPEDLLPAEVEEMRTVVPVFRPPASKPVQSQPVKKEVPGRKPGTVTGGAMRMLKAAAMFPEGITKTRMATLARLSSTSGSFKTYIATLKRDELMTGSNDEYLITGKGKRVAGEVEALPTDPVELIELWCEVVGANGGAARMLRILGNSYPKGLTKESLAWETELSHTSGSFKTYISTLKRNGLIQVESGLVKASPDLFTNKK